jgi:uncharacterized membrane protein YedE/YeeE
MFRIFLLGIAFGLTLTMGEVISWFRIQEMFQFQSFHMFGIIGSAVLLGVVFHQLSKRFGWMAFTGNAFDVFRYPAGWKNYLFGGIIFGLGWSMTGACPGPLFIWLGAGFSPVVMGLIGALAGTFVYGLVADKLP